MIPRLSKIKEQLETDDNLSEKKLEENITTMNDCTLYQPGTEIEVDIDSEEFQYKLNKVHYNWIGGNSRNSWRQQWGWIPDPKTEKNGKVTLVWRSV